jgi:hypothetical protein
MPLENPGKIFLQCCMNPEFSNEYSNNPAILYMYTNDEIIVFQ